MTEVNGRAVRPRGEPDDELVQRLRGLVADRMAQQAGRDGAMTAAARSRLGRALIREVMEEEAAAALTSGRAPLDQAAEQQVADRVYADLWGLGGFQPYLDDPEVESVNANGCDQVFVQYSGGYRSRVPPVAASDQELTDLIRAIAARGGIEERRFDRSSPRVSVPLPGGGRLFAVQAVTGRPCVAIRRDRPGAGRAARAGPQRHRRRAAGRVPRRAGQGPQEPADLRRHGGREDDHAAGAGQRHPARRSG